MRTYPGLDVQALSATALLVAYAAVYAMANTDLMWARPDIYYAKHATAALAALCALLWKDTFTGARRNMLLLATPYVLAMLVATQDWSASLQTVTFLLACSLYAAALQRRHWLLPVLLLIALIGLPLLRNVWLYGSEHLMHTYYGRERLLLGYFHPKEAANGVVACALACFMALERQHVLRILVMVAFGVLLFFVQSRNALLFLTVFLFANLAYRRIGLNAVTVLLFAAIVAAMTLLLTFDFDLYDELSSGRLRIWDSALDFPDEYQAAERRAPGVLTLRIDNFYVETYLQAGAFGLFAAASLLLFVALLSHSRAIHGVHAAPLLFAFCINAMFDSGMTSTGNVLQIVVWSTIIACWTSARVHVGSPAVSTRVFHA
jgi:hypothetical protein